MDLIKRYWKYIENSLWLIGERIFSGLFGLVVMAAVARYLEPSNFGLLSYTFSIAALFAVLGHLGLDGLVVRELVQTPEEANEILGTVFYMKVVAYLIATISLLFYAFLLVSHSKTEIYLFLWAAAFIALSPLTTFTIWFHAQIKARYVSISSGIALLLSGLIKILFILTGGSVIAFAATSLLQIIFTVIVGLFFYQRIQGPPLFQWTFSISKAQALFSESWMIFMGSIFAIIYLKIDQVMLRWIGSPEDVGVYAVAANLSEAAYFIPIAIVASVFPKLIELRKTDKKTYYNRLQNLFDLLSLSSFMIIIVIFFVGEPLVLLMFGKNYIEAAPILMIHILATPFIFLRFALSRWIIIEKFAIFSLITQGLGAVMNIILNLVLIPHYLGVGAAIATVISYATASYIALIFSSKTRPIFKMMSRSIFMPWYGIRKFIFTFKSL